MTIQNAEEFMSDIMTPDAEELSKLIDKLRLAFHKTRLAGDINLALTSNEVYHILQILEKKHRDDWSHEQRRKLRGED